MAVYADRLNCSVSSFKQNNDICQSCRLVVRSSKKSSHGSIRIHPSLLTINDCFVLFGLHITPSFSNFFSALSEWVSDRSIWWYDRRSCFRTCLRAIERCFRSVFHKFQIEFPHISLAVRLIFMGNSLLEIKPQRIDPWISSTMSTFLSRIPRQVVDQDKAGDVYILVFKGDVSIRKMAHHALLVDVAGDNQRLLFLWSFITSYGQCTRSSNRISYWRSSLEKKYLLTKAFTSVKRYRRTMCTWVNLGNGQSLCKSSWVKPFQLNQRATENWFILGSWRVRSTGRWTRQLDVVVETELSDLCQNRVTTSWFQMADTAALHRGSHGSNDHRFVSRIRFRVKRTNYRRRKKWIREVQMRCLHDQWLLSHWINVLSTWSSVSPSLAPIWLQTQCWTKDALIERRRFF